MQTIRILPLGVYGVGKSSIINQFVNHSFTQDYHPTHLFLRKIEFQPQDIKYNLELQDIMGVDNFTSIIDKQIQICDCFMIIFSITKLESFQQIEHMLNRIIFNKKLAKIQDVPIVLIGNKSDLEGQREVARSSIEEFQLKYQIHYWESSAKQGTNIRNIFQDLVQQHELIKSKKEEKERAR